jgi:small-conductance mechanosensitive channel
MKKIILFLTVGFFAIQFSNAQIPIDSVSGLKDSLNKISSATTEIKDSVNAITGKISNCGCQGKGKEDLGSGWILVFTPVLLFLIVFFIFYVQLKEFNFKDALSENEMNKYTILNPRYDADITNMITSIATAQNKDVTLGNLSDIVPPTLDVTILPESPGSPLYQNSSLPSNNYRPSISRYIAFFSGILTIITAVCMSSFFIYQYISTGCPPDLSALSTVLIALGLGVTPYAVNKISAALTNRKAAD